MPKAARSSAPASPAKPAEAAEVDPRFAAIIAMRGHEDTWLALAREARRFVAAGTTA